MTQFLLDFFSLCDLLQIDMTTVIIHKILRKEKQFYIGELARIRSFVLESMHDDNYFTCNDMFKINYQMLFQVSQNYYIIVILQITITLI